MKENKNLQIDYYDPVAQQWWQHIPDVILLRETEEDTEEESLRDNMADDMADVSKILVYVYGGALYVFGIQKGADGTEKPYKSVVYSPAAFTAVRVPFVPEAEVNNTISEPSK